MLRYKQKIVPWITEFIRTSQNNNAIRDCCSQPTKVYLWWNQETWLIPGVCAESFSRRSPPPPLEGTTKTSAFTCRHEKKKDKVPGNKERVWEGHHELCPLKSCMLAAPESSFWPHFWTIVKRRVFSATDFKKWICLQHRLVLLELNICVDLKESLEIIHFLLINLFMKPCI